MEWIDGVRLRSASSRDRMEAVARRDSSAGAGKNEAGLRGSEEDIALVEVCGCSCGWLNCQQMCSVSILPGFVLFTTPVPQLVSLANLLHRLASDALWSRCLKTDSTTQTHILGTC